MIGRLNKQVVLQKPVEANDHGETITSWTTLDTVWAEVLPRGSREAYRQAQVVGDLTHLVRIRNRSDVTAKHRFTLGTKVLKPLAPPQEVMIDGVWLLEIACGEVEV